MATANLYIINDDKRKLEKNLSNIIKENVNIFYKDATEFIRPIIILDYDGTWNMRDCNYVYLSDKNRYYFVEKHSLQKGQKVVYELLEDVRYSHKEGIKESKAIINYLDKNNINYIIYKNTNNKNAPFLIEIRND